MEAPITKEALLEQLKQLLQNSETKEILKEGKACIQAFRDLTNEEHAKLREQFVEDGGKAIDFAAPFSEVEKEFGELSTKFFDRRKEYMKQREALQTRALTLKRELLKEIKELAGEEHIGKAIAQMKEIQQRWKDAGEVAKDKAEEIRSEYRVAIDEFYYNLKIHRELLEFDLKKNMEAKLEVIEQLKKLAAEQNIKTLESLNKALHEKWDNIGPTFREKWEEIRDQFKAAESEINHKIVQHYVGLKENQKENLEKKEKLCSVVEHINTLQIKKIKKWQENTDKIKSIQEEWKTIGFAPKSKNDEVWERFKAACDQFFENKREFFNQLKSENDENKAKKEALIEQLEALKDSDDWKGATEKIIRLQKQWKQIGSAHQRDEQRLWSAFRAACDTFFTRKNEFYSTIDDRQAENLKAKKELIESLTAFEVSSDKDADLKTLSDIQNQFSEIGHVPIKEKGPINQEFSKAMNAAFAKLGLNAEQREEQALANKIESWKNSDELLDKLNKEKALTQEKIKQLEATKIQYENNMGFFSSANSNNPLLKEANEKLSQAIEQIDKCKAKIKWLNQEIKAAKEA